jgi:signal transduction histidine kinase
MQKRDSYLWFALLFSTVSHVVAFLQFAASFSTLGLPARWYVQFGLLVGGSLACATLQFALYRRDIAQTMLVLLRLLFLFIATYPLGNAMNVRATLVASFVFEAMIYYPVPWALVSSLALVAASVFLHNGVSVWNAQSTAASLDTLLFLGFYPLAVMFLGLLLKNAQRLASERKRLIEQLRQASTSLVETNIRLQEHVVRGEEQAKLLERGRISRELHDTVGYALMNIIVTMKASLELSHRDGERMREFMAKGIEQAQKGLADTRGALRELRAVAAQPLSLIASVDRLAGAFKDTHIAVAAHYSNMPWSFTEEIDATIYRIVQEGITNAIRHGNATKIDINLSLDGSRIGVAVLDNGSGTAEITEGIGMAGIRERLAQLGGGLSAGNSAGGFLLSAWLPFRTDP